MERDGKPLLSLLSAVFVPCLDQLDSRLFVGIKYKNITQLFVPFGTTGFPGNGGLDNVVERFNVASTGTNPRNPV